MIDFPASPTPGQRFTAAGATWIFDGVKWLPEGLAPTVAPGINENRIINGDMRIDQRNAGASGTAVGYTVDRWSYYSTVANAFFWGRNIGSPTTPAGFPYCLGVSTQTPHASVGSDAITLEQKIEADALSDLAWGTVNAQPVTLSFWVLATAGTYSGAIRNAAATRSYPFTFTVPSIWTKVVVVIPGDTVGSWTLSGNGVGIDLSFDLGSGPSVRGPANVWASGNYVGATGAASVVAASGQFYLTGVKLEIGSVATPFNRQSLAKSMADCQRYYQTGQLYQNSPASIAASSLVAISSLCPVTMRANATMVITTQASSNLSSPALSHNGNMFQANGTATGTGGVTINMVFSASAEL